MAKIVAVMNEKGGVGKYADAAQVKHYLILWQH